MKKLSIVLLTLIMLVGCSPRFGTDAKSIVVTDKKSGVEKVTRYKSVPSFNMECGYSLGYNGKFSNNCKPKSSVDRHAYSTEEMVYILTVTANYSGNKEPETVEVEVTKDEYNSYQVGDNFVFRGQSQSSQNESSQNESKQKENTIKYDGPLSGVVKREIADKTVSDEERIKDVVRYTYDTYSDNEMGNYFAITEQRQVTEKVYRFVIDEPYYFFIAKLSDDRIEIEVTEEEYNTHKVGDVYKTTKPYKSPIFHSDKTPYKGS